MQRCPLDDQNAHTRLVMALQISGAVSRNLWHMINAGANAVEEIKWRGKRID